MDTRRARFGNLFSSLHIKVEITPFIYSRYNKKLIIEK